MNSVKDISKLIGKDNLSVSEAMQKIDINASGILFIVDENERLLSCVTDGDIRRHLLAGGLMTDAVSEASNKHPKVAGNVEEAKKLYHTRFWVAIPIVNDDGRLIDIFVGNNEDITKPHNALNIPVVINAGGKGTRLDPFTKILPKPLIPVGDIPIIEHIMKEYQSYKCDEFHVIVNHKRDLIKAYFKDCETDYNITWYDEEKPLGTGGGLSYLHGKFENTVFFSNCDVLISADYEKILKFHKESHNLITMICAYKNINIPYGVVEMGANGIIEEMKEKPVMSFLTNTGVYIVEPEVVNDIEDNVSIDFPDIVKREKEKGKKVAVYPISENDWMDMGQLPELERMRYKMYGEGRGGTISNDD